MGLMCGATSTGRWITSNGLWGTGQSSAWWRWLGRRRSARQNLVHTIWARSRGKIGFRILRRRDNIEAMNSSDRERYSRQILFPGIGERGQEALLRSHAVVVGCGALGSFHAAALARAGVGHITIIDRDYVEPANLHRQWL